MKTSLNRPRPKECPPTRKHYAFILGRDSNLTALQTAIIWPKVVETVCFQVSLYTYIMRSRSVVSLQIFLINVKDVIILSTSFEQYIEILRNKVYRYSFLTFSHAWH
jgi:hypothetical protein